MADPRLRLTDFHDWRLCEKCGTNLCREGLDALFKMNLLAAKNQRVKREVRGG